MAIGNGFKVRLLRQKIPLLSKCTFRIFQNDVTPQDDSLTADFIEATYPGYAPIKPLKWLHPFLREDWKGELPACQVVLKMTGAAPTNDLFGWYMTDENGFFALGERFPATPVRFNVPLREYRYQVVILEDAMN